MVSETVLRLPMLLYSLSWRLVCVNLFGVKKLFKRHFCQTELVSSGERRVVPPPAALVGEVQEHPGL